MHSFRLKVIAIIVGISWAAAALMQLFNGLFFMRNLQAILPGLDIFAAVVLGITTLVALLIFIRLGPLARIERRLLAGEDVPLEERVGARRILGSVNVFIVAVNLLGFLLGPIMSISMNQLSGQGHITLTDAILLVLLNIGIGFMAGLQEMSLANKAMMGIRDRLDITRSAPGLRDFKIGTRFGVPAMAAIFLCACMFVMASIGILREYSSWLAGAQADAMSSATSVGADAVNTNELRHILEMVALFAAIALWTALLVASISVSVRAQVKRLEASMRSIAEGSADLSTRLGVIYFDELGELTVAFNDVLDSVGSLVGGVKGVAGKAVASASALDSSAAEAERAVGSLGSASSRVDAALGRQRGAVGATGGVLKRLGGSIAVVVEQVGTQAGFVEQSSAAISQMAANIGSATRMAAQADELGKELRSSAEGGGEAMRGMAGAMAEIEAASKSVADIVGSISRIAAQTNLLAMNAAIEAAHAGDAGAGFAVVADEVRSLAETSAKSAKEIIGVIRSMGDKIKSGVELAERSSRAFVAIREDVDKTTQLVNTIAQAMKEQEIGAHEILGSTNSLIEATERIRDLTVEQEGLSREMDGAMGAIEASVREIEAAAAEQETGAGTLARVVSEMRSEAAENADGAKELARSIDGFTT